jgi:hypothetical protein
MLELRPSGPQIMGIFPTKEDAMKAAKKRRVAIRDKWDQVTIEEQMVPSSYGMEMPYGVINCSGHPAEIIVLHARGSIVRGMQYLNQHENVYVYAWV